MEERQVEASKNIKTSIEVPYEFLPRLFGAFDENLRLIEKELSVNISALESGVEVNGEEANVIKTQQLFSSLVAVLKGGFDVDRNKIFKSIDLVNAGKAEEIVSLSQDTVAITAKGKQIKCKTLGQRDYVKSINKNTVVFGVGPAGTGKTYLAVALAVQSYKAGEVEKIILTRPAIEAGEKLGFLPGDLQMKVDPYLRPLYDALSDMFGSDHYLKLMERGIIEVAPLAYMRGRTLSRAFIILDEAQNTTNEQMKMFLTRFGEGSKVVITGDLTQIDLPQGKESGLSTAIRVLKNIDGLKVIELTEKDVVRHELVQKIVAAYAKAKA